MPPPGGEPGASNSVSGRAGPGVGCRRCKRSLGALAISVVIPTKDRCELLRRTLDCLGRQEGYSEPFEVIVADDSARAQTLNLKRITSPSDTT
ncbi:MAG: glycosyltransferase family 2 protein [Thermoanaerobaculia bacterium]